MSTTAVAAATIDELLEWPAEEKAQIETLLALRRWWMTDLYRRIRHEYDAAVNGGAQPAELVDAKPTVEALPSFQTFVWTDRYIQDRLWYHVGRIVDRRRELLDEALSPGVEDLGSIELDSQIEYPGYYEECDFHRQPGGIWRDRRGAAVYAMGARIIHVGRNDGYELHHKFVADLPIESPRRILDVGCGFGKTTFALKQRWPAAEVVGLDLAGPCLELGRRMATDREVAIVWKQGAAEELPYDDASFDLVTVTMVYHEMPVGAIHQAMAETYRILRPGGMLAALENRIIGDPLRDVLGAWHSDVIEEPYANPFRAERFDVLASAVGLDAEAAPWYPPGVAAGSEDDRSRYSIPWSLLLAIKGDR
jgi:ubiquinone/menaquinone biosynthesis C-methylase UbiE